jgi:hypothetical protein
MAIVILGNPITINVSIISPPEELFVVATGVVVVKDFGSLPPESTPRDGYTIAVQPLVSGSATIIVQSTDLGLGTHNLVAFYAGDNNFAASHSSVLTEIIEVPVVTSCVLTADINPANYGQNVTLTCTISCAQSIPDGYGYVIFYPVSGAHVAVVSTGGGATASLVTSSLSIGSDTVEAIYDGYADFAPSTSASIVIVVNKVTPTNILTSSLNPSSFNTPTILTATVAGAGPSTPTGSVTFKDGSLVLGTSSLTAGVGVLSTSVLAGGTHSITADYSGDISYTTLTSNTVTQIVDAATTSIVLTVDFISLGVFEYANYTATVSSSGGTPDGFVIFYDNITPIGSPVVLVAGVATLNTSFSTSGIHPITAYYTGTSNYGSNTSNIISEAVFAPTDLADIFAWYRSDLGVTATSTITAWVDQAAPSDATHTLVQYVAEDFPIYLSSDPDFNGRPSVGTSANVDEERGMASGMFTAPLAQPSTWYQVIRMPSLSANGVTFRSDNAISVNSQSLISDLTGTSLDAGDSGAVATATTIPDTTYVIITVYGATATSVDVYVNTYAGATASNTMLTGDRKSTRLNSSH